MSRSDRDSLRELLDSAKTLEDFSAIEDLIEEQERQRQEADKWIAATLGEVAEFFGLTVQAVKQWRMETPPVPGDHGRYPLKDIVAWRLGRLNGSTTLEAKRQADVESVRLVNEKRAMDNAIKRGTLIEREEVERDMALLWSRLVIRLQSIADKIANLVPAEQKPATKQRIEQEIHIMQKEFTDALEDLL